LEKQRHWLTLLCVAGALASISLLGTSRTAPVFAFDPQAERLAIPSLLGTPGNQSTPVPHPTIASGEADKLIPPDGAVSHPQLRVKGTFPLTAAMLASAPLEYQNHQVELSGKVVRINSTPATAVEGWEDAHVIVLDDTSAWISVVYRGGIKDLEVGDSVTVVGVFKE